MKKFATPMLVYLSVAGAVFFAVAAIITSTGIDSRGDLPGALRGGWLMLTGWLWSLVFASHYTWVMVKSRSWIALIYSALAVGFRLGHSFHAVHDVFLDFPWLWFPIEGFVYVLLSYPAPVRTRLMFLVWNLGLFGLQLLMVMSA